MKVRPTEYKGIRFDSKSEAVFARTLDLSGHQWIYHPAAHCGHEWDFLVFRKPIQWEQWAFVGGHRYISPFEAVSTPGAVLVEYKPSEPTMTYVDWLTDSQRSDPFESVVVWGNPWSKTDAAYSKCCYVCYPIFSSHSKYGWGDFIPNADNGENRAFSYRHLIDEIFTGITDEVAQQAKTYRFDLR